MAKRRTRGVLSSMAKAPKAKPKRKKRESPIRKVGRWAGTALVVVVMLAAVVLLGVRMFAPHAGETVLEGDFAIVEVVDDPKLFRAGAGEVAAAVFEIDGRKVSVPLSQEQKDTVEPGVLVHVRYTSYPVLGQIEVDEWNLVGE